MTRAGGGAPASPGPGRGPMAAMAFALQLTDLLADKEAAEKLRNLMQCQ